GDERGLRRARGRGPAGALDRRRRRPSLRRPRRDRGDRDSLTALVERGPVPGSRNNEHVQKQIEDYVRSLGLDAYLVGGAVRDELLGLDSKDADFLVLGVDHEQLRALLEPHGRVEDLEVAGQRVGLRLRPRDRELRELVRSGIEFAPPRRERSTGP